MRILRKKRKKEESDYENGYAKDFYGRFSSEKALKKAAEEAEALEKHFTHVIKENEKE